MSVFHVLLNMSLLGEMRHWIHQLFFCCYCFEPLIYVFAHFKQIKEGDIFLIVWASEIIFDRYLFWDVLKRRNDICSCTCMWMFSFQCKSHFRGYGGSLLQLFWWQYLWRWRSSVRWRRKGRCQTTRKKENERRRYNASTQVSPHPGPLDKLICEEDWERKWWRGMGGEEKQASVHK